MEQNNSMMDMMGMATLVMRTLARKGLRHHSLAYDLCHTCLLELVEQGWSATAHSRVDQLVAKVVAAELDHQQRTVFFDDLAFIAELRAQGVL